MINAAYYVLARRFELNRMSRRDKMRTKWYPCPGNIYHLVERNDILFERYNGRPDKSYVVYWRTHPSEYLSMITHNYKAHK